MTKPTTRFPHLLTRVRGLQLLAALLFLAATPMAAAQAIVSRAASQTAYVGEPLRVVVQVQDVDGFDGPFIPEVDGLVIKRLPGEQTSSRIEFINGRTTQSKTVGISYEVTPSRTGAFTIPPFSVTVGGQTLSSAPIPIKVEVSETGDLLWVAVSSTPRTMFVGERGRLDLEIGVKRYRDEKLGITLDEGSLWSLVDTARSSWGSFGPTLQRMLAEGTRPRGQSRMVGDTEYIVYTISREFDPISSGTPPLGEIRVRVEYPTALRRGNDFLFEDRLSMVSSRTVSAEPSRIDTQIVSAPEGGRPNDWNGAIGDFAIDVVARPVDVAVGDPITLTIRLTDRSARASLDGLQSPDLMLQPGFPESFRIPADAAAGTVDGRSKIFTQTIRATSDGVREIPAIRFSAFDPRGAEYRTISSAPIALTVRPSAAARVLSELPAAESPAARAGLTKVEGGLLANASIEECTRVGTLTLGQAALTLAAPIAAAGLVLVSSRLKRRRDPVADAYRSARARFAEAMSASSAPDALEAALLRYIGARCGGSAAGIARNDALDLLARAGASQPLLEETEARLRELERARYLSQPADPQAVAALVDRIERETPSPQGVRP